MSSPDTLISEVRFAAAGARDVETGLLGWTSFKVGQLRVDGVAVRRTERGTLALSFPARRSSSGARHYYVRPVDDDARREFEEAVLTEVGHLLGRRP